MPSFDGTDVLNNVNLSVNQAETLVLLGPNGCGKTTLLKLINRLIEPDKGSIFIDERNIRDQPKEELRRSIGYVIQNTGLLSHLSIKQNIELIGKIASRQVKKNKLSELLNLIGLKEDVLFKYPDELSGGQQQRVGVARALATDPEIVLMDEPFSTLDNITKRQVQDDFLNLKHLDNKTILLVTHDIQEAFRLGDKIVLLDNGEIQQIGTPLELLYSPESKKVDEFLQKDRLILSLRSSLFNSASVFDMLNDRDRSPTEKMDALKKFLKAQ